VITTEADGAWCVYAADLDGDGDMDVLSASYDDGKIAWYANDGMGRFESQQVISKEAHGAQCVYAADLDGDGDLDVLSLFFYVSRGGSYAYSKIAWYVSDGTGQFGPEQVITTEADGIGSVYPADLDNDGDLDVLSASRDDAKIAWYVNDGMGHFGPEQMITTENVPTSSIYAADLDGDGDMDILFGSDGYPSYNETISWCANNGTGQFGPRQVIITGISDFVYPVDLDGDGDLDIISPFYGDNKIAWYANDRAGHFGPQQVITTEADGIGSVYPADLDGDGDLDVLSASIRLDKIAWYASNGTGQFEPEQVITTAAVSGARCVYATDLDNDGDVDVLSACEHDNKIAWYANDGAGQFGPQQVITTEANGASCVYAADLDGDGDMDVLSASSGSNPSYEVAIAWYANDGAGQFGPQQVITSEADYAQSVYAADLDGDGDLDVLSASSGDDKIAWYANDGAGQFGTQQLITTAAAGARCVYAADLDGDGDLDILSASFRDDKIAWYENE